MNETVYVHASMFHYVSKSIWKMSFNHSLLFVYSTLSFHIVGRSCALDFISRPLYRHRHTHTPNDWCSTAINFLFSDHKTIAFYKPSVANKQSSLIHSDGFWQNIIMNRRKISVRVATTGAEKKKIIILKSKPATVRVDGNENGK